MKILLVTCVIIDLAFFSSSKSHIPNLKFLLLLALFAVTKKWKGGKKFF